MTAAPVDNREAHEKIAPACEGERCSVPLPCALGRCMDVANCRALGRCLALIACDPPKQ